MIELQTLVEFFQAYGYFMVFGVLILCGFGLPIPEDISLVSGGIISGMGHANVHVMFIVGLAGVLIGDTIVYNLGKLFGERVMQKKLVGRLIPEKRYNAIRGWFATYGRIVIFAARFMPGLRTPIFATAGITRFISYPRFILIDGFAALISVPFWVYIGYFGASQRDKLVEWITRGHWVIFIIIGISVILIVAKTLIQKRLGRVKEQGNATH